MAGMQSHFKSEAINMTKQNKTGNPEARRAFIEKHKDLFWFTPADKKYEVSDAVLIETILNLGDLKAIRELFNLLGLRHTASVFRQQTAGLRSNYFKEVAHYFTLYFNKYVPQHFE
jgi:hypothetical protein